MNVTPFSADRWPRRPGSAATADILYLGVQTGIFLGEQIASLA